MSDRAALVAAARDTIAQGSQSFAAASKLFAPATRERAWLLYAWCRAADDMTDGQELGHGASALDDPAAAQARLEALTALALYSGEEVPLPFAALRAVAHETAMPARFIEDHLAGFALDALAARLVEMARPYRRSARVGAARLPGRSRLAVLAADAIYGTIGEKVLARGTHAWDERVRVSGGGKILLLGQAMLRSLSAHEATSRDGLWTRPRQS